MIPYLLFVFGGTIFFCVGAGIAAKLMRRHPLRRLGKLLSEAAQEAVESAMEDLRRESDGRDHP